MIKKPIGKIFKSKILRIGGKLRTNGNKISRKLAQTYGSDLKKLMIISQFLKRCLDDTLLGSNSLGWKYENVTGQTTDTLDEIRRFAIRKDKKAEASLQKYLKYMQGARLEIVNYLPTISNLGSLDKD
jgi:hypothetical protein